MADTTYGSPQPVKQIDWQTLVNAADQSTDFPVIFSFGAPAPTYMDVGAISKAFSGAVRIGDSQGSPGAVGRAFVELDPYAWAQGL